MTDIAKDRERAVERIFGWIAPDAARDIEYTHFENRSTFAARVYEWDYEDHDHEQWEKDTYPELTGTVEDPGQVTFNVPQD